MVMTTELLGNVLLPRFQASTSAIGMTGILVPSRSACILRPESGGGDHHVAAGGFLRKVVVTH